MKRIQSVGFEQSTKNLLRFSFRKNNFSIGKKDVVETTSKAINNSSDLLCFDLCLMNIFEKSSKAERWRDVLFKVTLYCFSVTAKDLNL